jgi:hypothetical protein
VLFPIATSPWEEVISEGLRLVLHKNAKQQKTAPVGLATFGRKGNCPGVDLDSNAALIDAMEVRIGDDGSRFRAFPKLEMAASIGLGGGKAVIGCTQGSAGSATIAQKRLFGDPGGKHENF